MSSSELRARRAAALVVALAAASSSARAEPTPPAPPSTGRPLVWVGATLFVAPYLASVVGASAGYADADATTSRWGALWVPVVGPWVALGQSSSGSVDALLVLDGLTQIAGLTLFVAGVTSRAARPAALSLAVTPLASRGASGLTVLGRF